MFTKSSFAFGYKYKLNDLKSELPVCVKQIHFSMNITKLKQV